MIILYAHDGIGYNRGYRGIYTAHHIFICIGLFICNFLYLNLSMSMGQLNDDDDDDDDLNFVRSYCTL